MSKVKKKKKKRERHVWSFDSTCQICNGTTHVCVKNGCCAIKLTESSGNTSILHDS